MKETSIALVCQESTMQALIMPDHTPLVDALNQFAQDHSRHGIFLVDADQRLTGVINNRDLLAWARVQFDLPPKDARLPVGTVRRLLRARTIGDMALPDSRAMSVKLTDSLATALETMSRLNLEDIAVVDTEWRIVNDLRLSEVLSFTLRTIQ